MSNYPDGMTKSDWTHIGGLPETEESGECDACDLKFDDLTFVWHGDQGVAECPNCLAEIWKDAPEPDYDSIAEAKAEAMLERHMYDE